MKAVARLALGWLLMLAGAVLMFEAGTPTRPQSKLLTALEVTAGFAFLAVGVWLRRTAARRS